MEEKVSIRIYYPSDRFQLWIKVPPAEIEKELFRISSIYGDNFDWRIESRYSK